MATIIEYFEVLDDDGYNRDGPSSSARFLSLIAAEKYAALNRNRYVNKTKKKIIIYDSAEEVDLHKREDLKQSAISKLTTDERVALGV